MPKLSEFVSEKIAKLKDKNIYRSISTVERLDFPHIFRNGQKLISFGCNDYLALSQHPMVKEAAIMATEKFGAGAGASRLVSGSSPLYEELESSLAGYHKRQEACVFGSGYLANIGVINCLAAESDLIVADKLAHACMIDGAILSGAKLIRFSHNNLSHLEEILQKNRGDYSNCIILTETIFSMDGDKAPLTEIKRLAEKYDCWLITDGAHNLAHNQAEADIIVGTLSKTLGSYGGYVVAEKEVVDYIKSSARSLIFSTALPPSSLAAAIAAITVIKQNPEELQKPIGKADFFCSLIDAAKPQSQITPIIIGDEQKATELAAKLESEGFYVPAIRPPTVPPGTSRLRFSFSAAHIDNDIENLANAIRHHRL